MATDTRPFVARPEHWDRNRADSARAAARPAYRTDPNGQTHPGIIISQGPGRILILSPDDALRVATQIADALDHHRQKETTTP